MKIRRHIIWDICFAKCLMSALVSWWHCTGVCLDFKCMLYSNVPQSKHTKSWDVKDVSCITTASFSKAGWILMEFCRVFHRLWSHSSEIRENFQTQCPSASAASLFLLHCLLQSLPPSWGFVSLLIPFLCLTLWVSSHPSVMCTRDTRGTITAKPRVPLHREQLRTLSTKTSNKDKCCGELFTMDDKMFG